MREEIRENVQREVKKKVESEVKQKVMQALIDSTTLELPKSRSRDRMQRMVQQTRADLEAPAFKLERLPVKPERSRGRRGGACARTHPRRAGEIARARREARAGAGRW